MTNIPGEHIVPDSSTERIEYIGIGSIPEEDRVALEALSTQYHEKMRRKIKAQFSVVVHVKLHGTAEEDESKAGRRKYTVHVRLQPPFDKFYAEGFDFDIKSAAHQAFTAMVHELEHSFHGDEGVTRKSMDKHSK